MEPMIKWIGGATAALLLVLGGATLAGDMLNSPSAATAKAPEKLASEADFETDLANAIPVDEAALEGSLGKDGVKGNVGGDDAAAKLASDTAKDKARLTRVNASSADKPKAKSDERFVVKRILDIDGPMKYGDWHWDTKGVPDGPVVVTVDLKARVISVFRGGYEIGAAVAMLGTKEHPTPVGTFPILWKQRHNVSEKYNNAPMPWSMFITRDGVAIHGGNAVENGYASHGCIAIPDELASRLFAVAKKGDKVIITNGATMGLGDKII